VLRLAFAFDSDGRLPYDTILYSCIKKSGKTTLNGASTLAWGFTQEAPNEILILANDLERRAGIAGSSGTTPALTVTVCVPPRIAGRNSRSDTA